MLKFKFGLISVLFSDILENKSSIGFSSSDKSILSDVKLYYASPTYKQNNGEFRTGFVNLSDSFFRYEYDEEGNNITKPILEIYNDSNDTITLNNKQRKQFLERTKVNETDSLFIYDITNDKVLCFYVKNLPVIACINIYFSPREYKREEFDYEFGFDLGKNFTIGSNFIFVGKNNPFVTGELKPIIWKEINKNLIDNTILKDSITINLKNELRGFSLKNSYFFSQSNLKYYLQDFIDENYSRRRLLLIFDAQKEQIIHLEIQKETEGISFNAIKTIDNNIDYGGQFTGKLIKNKNDVFFGFLNYSFSCPSITVLDKTEPKIPILCDNRH